MSTIEKVLIQIFERKDRIIDHVKQQILLFDHHLASKCLIDGFVPPPWLLSPFPSQLNKEDIISGLLLPHPQPSIPYCSLYQQPVVTTDNVQLAHVLCTRVDAYNKGLDQCLSGKADEQDPSVTSPPQDCRAGIISDICPDPGLSLARIQRSNSRQRALEHRSSAKACKNESFDKYGDACSSRNNGSKIASVRSDPVDKLELIGSGHNVVSCVVEKEERGQCWSRERSENVYSGRVTRSRSFAQPSKSMSGSSGSGNTSCAAKQDGVVLTESISKSRQRPDVVHELLESKFVEPVHDNVSCALKIEERGQCRGKKRGEDIYSGRITRSRISVQPPRSVNSPSSAGKSFSVAKQDGTMLTESINKSRLQPDAAAELLQFVKSVDYVASSAVAKEERGQCQSKERGENIYSGSITGSRSSIRSPKFVNGISCASKASDVAKCDSNMLIESISKSKQQPNVVDELLQLVKPAVMSNKSCSSRKSIEQISKEKENGVYQGRLTRSRSSSHQHNSVNKHWKLDSFPDRSVDDGICKSMQLACHAYDLTELIKPSDITDGSCGIKAKMSDKQMKENAVVEQYNDGISGSRANHSANLFKLVDSSNTLEYEVTRSKSKASDKSQYAKSSDRSEGVELKEVSGTQVYSLLCANDNGLAELNQCDAIVADTDADSDELIEAHSASSASNLDGAYNPPLARSLNRYERIGLEAIGTCPNPASAMMVMPKQLHFDDFEECTLNEASSLISQSEVIKSLEKRPLTPLPSADQLDEATSVGHQEKYNSYLENHLLEEAEAFSKEEKRLDTYLNPTSGPGRTSNLNVMSTKKETPAASTESITSMQLESSGISKQKIFMEDLSTTFNVGYENLLGNSLKDSAGSNSNADTATDYLFEKDCGKLEVVKSVTSVAEATSIYTGVWSAHEISTDIDFTGVCGPALQRKAAATSSDAIVHPSAALFEETKGHSLKKKTGLSPSQNQNADSIRRCIADDIDSVLDHTHPKSSENKVAIQLIKPGRHSGSLVDGSWPHKRRKIDGQRSNSPSLSPSPKGKYNWKERGRNENTPSTFMHKQLDVASVSSLPHETPENFEDHSVEGTGVVDPSGFMSDSTKKGTADEYQILFYVGDKSKYGNIGHLACDEKSKQESKWQLGEDGEFSTSLISSPCPPTDLISADQSRPEPEGFIIQTDNEQICIGGDGISFDKLDLPKTTIERASLLEQLCKSASIHTPVSQFPTTYRLHRGTDLYQSVPNGLLQCLDLRNNLPENDDRKTELKVSTSCFGEDTNHAFLGGYFSDCLPSSSSQVTEDAKKAYLSPVGKLWDRITSNSDNLEKRGSLNPELPCISEENENTEEVVDAFQEDTAFEVVTFSVKRDPLAEIRECPNVPASVSGAEIFTVRDSLDSVNTAYSFTGTENGIKQTVGEHNARKRRDTNKLKENRSILPGANGSKRESESLRNRFSKPKLSEKTNMRKGGPRFSQKESKVNNIVSNVTSFIPIVQQKQAASIITGKRDVKVKALETAEAAKKLAEKKENDRKMKREAFKLERARLEQENLRQLELEKKRKEEERKKKEADMAAKKRQREEEERLEKERKRKRMEEAWTQQRAPEEKLRSKKDEKEKKCQATDERAQKMKAPNDEAGKLGKVQNEIASGNEGKMSEMEFRKAVASTSDSAEASTAIEDYPAQAKSTTDRAIESNNLIVDASQEQSYDISPYKVSDDEDEEDDDEEPNSKFIPSWASKNRVAQVVAFQQKLDPEVIFPPESFSSISQVLFPRKLQQNHAS